MKTIAWDVDDVLNDLMRVWFEEKWIIQRPKSPLRYVELAENPPHNLLGISKEEYLSSLDEFRLSIQYRKMQPVSEVKNWFLRYGRCFRHIAVTAVPVQIAHLSAEWTLRHFGCWIRTFHFVPSVRRGYSFIRYDKTKKDFLQWLNKVDMFVDDNEINVRAAKKTGIKGILFPRPWNASKLSVKETLEMIND